MLSVYESYHITLWNGRQQAPSPKASGIPPRTDQRNNIMMRLLQSVLEHAVSESLEPNAELRQ